jgi:hypothetical protein
MARLNIIHNGKQLTMEESLARHLEKQGKIQIADESKPMAKEEKAKPETKEEKAKPITKTSFKQIPKGKK